MSVHYDRAQEQLTPRKKYNELTKALSFARKLEKVNDEEFEAKLEWEEKAETMNLFTQELIVDLKQEKLGKLGKQLDSKRRRLKWEKIKIKYDNLENDQVKVVFVDEVDSPKEIETVAVENYVKGQYYGLATGTEVIPSHNASSEKEVLRLVNLERKKLGMEPLVWDENLAIACRYHAYDMGTQSYFDHNSHDRKGDKLIEVAGTFKRIRKFYGDSFVNSENIAAGNETAEGTYSQWYHSKGHYDNMFNSSSKKVGIGVVYTKDSPFGYYWAFCTAL